MFHCFGCGKNGDALTFLMEHEGLTFVEALTKLADRGGIRLPALREEDPSRDFLRTQLLEFGKFAASFFTKLLSDPMRGSSGRQYLDTRQLNEDTVKRFGLGCVPDGWSNLLDAAHAKGFKHEILDASGMFKQGESERRYDFFRNRVIFPVRDVSGNVVAFGGRDLGDSPAKYINSPETPVYRKSRVLYGLSEAREALRVQQRALVVEGYFDVLRCFDAGIENVVATCGTALTPDQASLLRRYVTEAVLVYDGDAAGIKAALKGTGVLAAAGLSVRALVLPEGQDPDDYIRDNGAETFNKLVESAPDFVTFFVEANRSRATSIEGRTEVAHELFEILNGMDDALRVDEYLKHMGKALGLNEWACKKEYTKYKDRSKNRFRHEEIPEETLEPIERDDQDYIRVLVDYPPLLTLSREALAEVSLGEGALAEVLRTLHSVESISTLHQSLQSEGAQRLYAAAVTDDPIEGIDAENLVNKQIRRIQKQSLLKHSAKIQLDIEATERNKDSGALTKLLTEKVQIEQQLQALGSV
jgi:DNA primase